MVIKCVFCERHMPIAPISDDPYENWAKTTQNILLVGWRIFLTRGELRVMCDRCNDTMVGL